MRQLSMHAPYAPYSALNSAKLSVTHIAVTFGSALNGDSLFPGSLVGYIATDTSK